QPDGVLLDLMLPLVGGVDILRKIRAQKQFQKLPVIVFTNSYASSMIHEAMEAGATQVFNKAAIMPQAVVDALNRALYPLLPSVASSTSAPPRSTESHRLA